MTAKVTLAIDQETEMINICILAEFRQGHLIKVFMHAFNEFLYCQPYLMRAT